MSRIMAVSSVKAWQEMLAASDKAPFLILKHSTRCPISTAALQVYTGYSAEPETELTCCLVHVIENRDVSNAIAEATGIRHESPQIHLIIAGESVWNASHRGITRESILQSVNRFLRTAD